MKKLLIKLFPNINLYKKIIANIFLKNKGLEYKQKKINKKYNKIYGRKINWNNPTFYTEKIQVRKLNPKPIMTELSDKVLVKKYVSKIIGDQYIIPTLDVYERAEDINFEKYQKKVFIKTNHASGSNYLFDPKNTTTSIKKLRKKLKLWEKIDFSYTSRIGFEMQYTKIKPKIIVEPFINDKNGELRDYKFLCFDGEPMFFWIDFNRGKNHKRNIYDLNWQLQRWNQREYGNFDGEINRPKNFDKMIEIVRKLARGFDHVRIDLYNVDNKIYFGEFTFTNGNGFEKISPTEYDKYLGTLWNESE